MRFFSKKNLFFSMMFFFHGIRAQALKLPVFDYVGVIPLAVETNNHPTKVNDRTISFLKDFFYQSVEKSRRFRLLQKDLIGDQWSTEKGRKHLEDEFDLSGYVHLTISYKEKIFFIVRLLSPKLDVYLQETYSEDLPKFIQKSEVELKSLVEELTFKLLNRLPLDIYVTSIQGKFITLSGGKKQNLSKGRDIKLVRTSISSLHPATKSWNSFDSHCVGDAKIIEVKEETSVAQLTNLAHENALEIGDGFIVTDSITRKPFSP